MMRVPYPSDSLCVPAVRGRVAVRKRVARVAARHEAGTTA